jgi:hypothetical protein
VRDYAASKIKESENYQTGECEPALIRRIIQSIPGLAIVVASQKRNIICRALEGKLGGEKTESHLYSNGRRALEIGNRSLFPHLKSR